MVLHLRRPSFRMRVDDPDYPSDDEDARVLSARAEPYQDQKSLEKNTLLHLGRQHHLKVQEEVRSNLAALERRHQDEIQRTLLAFLRLQKYAESRKEIDTRLDVHFQRKIAEVLDKHISMVQRDHELISQIIERKISDEAALEEAKRKEQATMEENINQEKTRLEAEARQKAAAKLIADAQKAAYEVAQKKAAKLMAAVVSLNSTAQASMVNKNAINSELPGIKVCADDSALEVESQRRALHDQLPANIHLSKEFSKYDREISKSISKLTPTTDSVKARARELIKALDGLDCPGPIACGLFANKIVSIVKSRNSTKDKTFANLAFACGYVMVLVVNQVPDAMDYLLAEFHKVCIYTVPKHLYALNAQARNRDYHRLIGYPEENGKLESTERYLTYVIGYVKLYAAMIQTEIKGVRHPHGLAEGWKWLAMFLNALPATTATACALHAFLKMAGFALHKRYGSQFMKILDVISRCFLPALKVQGSKVEADAVSNLENYLNDKVYLEEPEGRHLAQQLLSKSSFM